MDIVVKKITNRCQLRQFIIFQEKLYKDDPLYVPALMSDEMQTLRKDLNPAFDFCDADYFLAYRDGKPVGRIAAIQNNKANSRWDEKTVRFGWFDTVNDLQVAKALLDTVESWGKERGCTAIEGPLGFTDMDKEGLQVGGFGQLPSITVIYNAPYYSTLLEELGYVKSVDWTQKKVILKDEMPPVLQFSDKIESKFGFRFLELKNKRQMQEVGRRMFYTLNDAFHDLHEFTTLTDRQIDVYVKQYVPLMNKKLVGMVESSDGELAGFIVASPSLSRAMQKAHGRLLPFGWFHILRALKKNTELDALMVGVLPKYQGTGALVVLVKHVYENLREFGIKTVYMNPQLEENVKVQTAFDYLEPEDFMRRRCYIKKI